MTLPHGGPTRQQSNSYNGYDHVKKFARYNAIPETRKAVWGINVLLFVEGLLTPCHFSCILHYTLFHTVISEQPMISVNFNHLGTWQKCNLKIPLNVCFIPIKMCV